MPLLTFACPACQKVLKSFSPITAGTRVKCPTCGASFAMTAQAAAPAAVPSVNGAPLPPPTAPAMRKRRRLLVGAAAVLLLAALGVGAYVLFWRGIGGIGGHPEEDPLAYLPAGTGFVVGADMPTLLDDPLLGPAIEESIRSQPGAGDFLDRCSKETGLNARELLGHSLLAGKPDYDILVRLRLAPQLDSWGGNGPRPSPVTIIMKPSRPIDPQHLLRAVEGARRHTAHGKTYYEVNVGDMRTLYVPSNRIIVLSMLSASELDAVFASDGTKPNLSADGLALVRDVQSHPCWAVLPFEGTVRADLERQTRQENPRALFDSLLRAKGAAVWGDADGERLRFGADMPCADERDAAQVAAEAESAWKDKRAQLAALEVVLGFQLPKTMAASRELSRSVRLTADGTTARGSAEISRKALADASEELQKGQQPVNLLGGFPGLVPKLPPGPRKSR